ncbi:MAG: lipid-A-disaccharide synthase [Arachidicoccus sp.]|nr:lipid-A-disaccharide synthase [Arachidicoccus sp.]
MKYYIIAGEASGDLHGSNLIKELQQLDTAIDIRCWGGDKMKATGATLVKHYKDLAFMGFAEVIANIRTILKNLGFCKKDIIQYKPDTLVLIDYPGFNLRIAEWAKKQGIKVVYYIAPQVWAWKESRVPKMMKCIDKMLVILPFEKDYFKSKFNWNVDYVGHPLVKVIDDYKEEHNNDEPLSNKKIIAVLPGSRKQEIRKKLPVMLQTAKHFPEYQFIVAQAPSLENDFYNTFLHDYPNVSVVNNETYRLLSNADAAMVTSGTATLETALFGVPEIVCYKGSNISYQIAKRLIKVKYISLVNLIMNKLVVKELIQHELTERNLHTEMLRILTDKNNQEHIQNDYREIKNILSAGGNASANAANEIVDFTKMQ